MVLQLNIASAKIQQGVILTINYNNNKFKVINTNLQCLIIIKPHKQKHVHSWLGHLFYKLFYCSQN